MMGVNFTRTLFTLQRSTLRTHLRCVYLEFFDMINRTFVGKELSNSILEKVSLQLGGVSLQQGISVL